jgi:type II secretory pathway component PulM
MTKFLDKLNLRPGERRLVVVVAIVVFLVLNVWLVWPSFGEWGRTEQRITDARKKVRQFQNELAAARTTRDNWRP